MFAEGSHQRDCCQEGGAVAVGDSSGWMCNSSRTNFVFRAENSRSWSQDVPQVWGCEPASLPIPAGALIPSQTAHQLPPSLSGCCQKQPSSFSLSGKESTAHPQGNRSPTPWPEVPQPCSTACCCLHSADILCCAGDQWHWGQLLLSCKCRSECFVL